MFGTPEKPGLIPQCLQRIFVNVGQNIDDKVFFKPDGLENLIPTSDSTLDIEISARNYIFKDDKNDTVHRLRFSLSSTTTIIFCFSVECDYRKSLNNKVAFKIYQLKVIKRIDSKSNRHFFSRR